MSQGEIELKGVKAVGKDPRDVEGAYNNPAFDNADDIIREDDDPKDTRMADEDKPDKWWVVHIQRIQDGLSSFYINNKPVITTIIGAILLCLYFAYFAYALSYEFGSEPSVRLLVVTILVVLLIVGRWVMSVKGEDIVTTCSGTCATIPENVLRWAYYIFMVAFALFALLYIIFEVAIDSPKNAIPLAGLAMFVLVCYVFSYNPAKVKWRPVLWGLYIQFAFACIILRWEFGLKAFKWLGDRVSQFLSYSDVGAQFVFGDDYVRHFFAFKVLPVIIYFSTMISVLYYLGVMQFVIRTIARFMAFAMGTSPAESLNAAGNIFIGMSEAPLMLRPVLKDLTMSELHAILTGGFATIAGSVMAAYILYGVPANHLLAASVMSAPAALAMSKLLYPETEKVKVKQGYNLEKMPDINIIDAASNGASNSIKLVANVAVNLIAFLAILAFVNATLEWFGHRAGMNDPVLSFELICSYVFYPMAFLMGTDTVDCRKIAELIGVKTFLNEFVAYSRLSVFLKNREYFVKHSSVPYDCISGNVFYRALNHTLKGGMLTSRSEIVATYALCGFANIGSMGIMLGTLGALAPSRKSDVSRIVLRAMIAGNIACFMTACIAGILLEPESSLPFAPAHARLDKLLLNNTLCP